LRALNEIAVFDEFWLVLPAFSSGLCDPGHEMFSPFQNVGLAGLKKGELLTLAESNFDVFRAQSYKNIRYQQNLAGQR